MLAGAATDWEGDVWSIVFAEQSVCMSGHGEGLV